MRKLSVKPKDNAKKSMERPTTSSDAVADTAVVEEEALVALAEAALMASAEVAEEAADSVQAWAVASWA